MTNKSCCEYFPPFLGTRTQLHIIQNRSIQVVATDCIHPVRIKDLAGSLYYPGNQQDCYLSGEHGDVMKLSAPSLFDGDSQEESTAIFGEHWFLVLQKS